MKTTWITKLLAALALTGAVSATTCAQDPNSKSPELRLKDEKESKVTVTAKTAADDPRLMNGKGPHYKEFAIPVEPDKVYTLTREGFATWQVLRDADGRLLQQGWSGDRGAPPKWSQYFQVDAKTVVYAQIWAGGKDVVGREFTLTLTARSAPKPEAIALTDGKFAREATITEADGLYKGQPQKTYLMKAEKGQKFNVELVGQEKRPFHLHLVVIDSAGKEVKQVNLFQTKFEAPADGTYRVIVNTGGITRGDPIRADYTLSIRKE